MIINIQFSILFLLKKMIIIYIILFNKLTIFENLNY